MALAECEVSGALAVVAGEFSAYAQPCFPFRWNGERGNGENFENAAVYVVCALEGYGMIFFSISIRFRLHFTFLPFPPT